MVDTTTTTTTTTVPTVTDDAPHDTPPATPTTSTGEEVGVLPTVPATTLVPTPVTPRFPTTGPRSRRW